VAWTVRALGPREIWLAARAASPIWLVGSAVPIAGRFLLWGLKWRRMLRRRESVPYGLCVRVLMAGSFANLTMPTAKLAGGVVRALLLRRYRGWPFADAYGWALADQVTNGLGQLLLFGVLAGSGATLATGAASELLRIAALAVLVVLGGATAGVAVLRTPGLQRLQDRLAAGAFERLVPARWRRGASGTAAADWLGRVLRPLIEHPLRFVGDVAGGAVAFAGVCVANAMVFRALGLDVPFAVSSAAMVGGYFFGAVVGGWGGIGITEAALTGLYLQLDVPAHDAAAAALLHRAVFYCVVLGWGGAVVVAEGSVDPRART
jgi:uncharacterized membrane protein YbhN (UPF0104 family)